MTEDGIKTSQTLIEKIKNPSDNKAWGRFYQIYSPILFGFIRSRGLDRATAEDILQMSMAEIVRYIPSFEYDPKKGKFRSVLFKTVARTVYKWSEDNKKRGILLKEAIPIHETEISDPRSRQMFEEFEKKVKNNLIGHALSGVRERVEPATWKSFVLQVLKEKAAQAVADELSIPNRMAVYKQKERVITMLKEEVKKIQQEIGEEDESIHWCSSDFADKNLKTSYFDNERPKTEVTKRIELLRKLYINHPPPGDWSPQFLVVTSGNSRWVDIKGKFYVGSAPNCTLKLNSELVSSQHFIVSCDQNIWRIRDLQSKNGVSVNNKPVSEKILNNGDIVKLGEIELIFITT